MTAARATLRRLAVPRLTATPGAAAVTADVRNTLEALGYTMVDQHFTFSAWPVRHGVRTIGILCGAALAFAAALIALARPVAAVVLLVLLAVTAALFMASANRLVMQMPWHRTTGTNLWAVPKGASRFLIVAHRDSKSQTIPLAFRIAAAFVLLAIFGLLLLAAADVAPLAGSTLAAIGASGLGAGVVLGFCGVGNESAGALDNASGLATLLHVAERERGGDVAFLVTDAEEFGLAGSIAALAEREILAAIEAVINFDGVDDKGGFFILEGRVPGRTGVGPASAVEAAAHTSGHRVRRRPVPPGLMVDHVPFLRSGIPALTLMHGGLLSLARVHRPSDNLERLSGEGIGPTVELTCAALSRLRGQDAGATRAARVAPAEPAL